MAGTIQFAASLQMARQQLADDFPALAVPQSKPLSPGAHGPLMCRELCWQSCGCCGLASAAVCVRRVKRCG